MARLTLPYRRLLEWFEREDSPAPLAFFRIALSSFFIYRLFVSHRSFLDIYGQYGFVQWAITRANLYAGLPHLGNVVLLLEKTGLTADGATWVMLALFVLVLLGLLVGWHTRLMSAAAFFLNFLWMHAGGGLVYGMDIFAHIGLFYLMIMPSGDALSFDVARGRRLAQPSVAAGVTRRMLQLQVVIVYASSGLEKAHGVQWWNGDALWRSVMLPIFHQFEMEWLARAPLLPMMAGWFVVAIEIGYGVFIWFPRTRRVWLSLTVAMHFFIGLLLGMWLFGLIMIILNLAAFGAEALRDAYGPTTAAG